MILNKVDIHGFRSVINDLAFEVRPTLTCLIGANEHGKTNLLDAVYLLDDGVFDSQDGNSANKSTEVPRLDFTLTLSADEGDELATLLTAARDEYATADPEAHTAKLVVGLESVLDSLAEQSSVSIKYSLLSDNSRVLRLPRDDGKFYSWKVRADSPATSSTALASATKQVDDWVKNALPRALLFSPELDLADHVTLDELEKGTNPAFCGLLKLANAWDARAELFQNDNVGHRAIDRVERAMTRRLRRIWSQGAEHTIQLNQSNGVLHLSIKDPVTFDKPSQRSLGFRSFFSFYLTLYNETQDVDPSGYVLLFDEPGIHLHPAGQKDLLREMRKLARTNQIVYSTHSPFMIDRNDLSATYLVRKGRAGKSKGTYIVQKPYGSNWAALNDALGITPADGFFPAERILLVEGRSDKAFINGYMSLCQPETKADLNLFSAYDAPHEDEAMIRSFMAAERKIVRLVDGDQAGAETTRRKARARRKSAADTENRETILNLSEFWDTDKPISIEDLLPEDLWMTAVGEYAVRTLKFPGSIDYAEIREQAKGMSLGRSTSEYFANVGAIKEPRAFSKATVAHLYFMHNVPVPDSTSPLFLLCARITSELGLAD